MLRWFKRDNKNKQNSNAFCSVAEGLQNLYRTKLLPVEQEHQFHSFYSPPLTDADFQARPMVLLLGQYSTGKSTFIRHLLGRDYPGLRIGPEPTTDKFVAVALGDQDQVIPGNALVSDPSMPFSQLSHFGNGFLGKFECSKLPSPVLEGLTLIDSPGVLSGEKQRLKRGYDMEAIVAWFADRVDMILLLFDVSKLDISDEFRRVIVALKGNDHKIQIVLNKADRVTTPQLMRVYGALMWSLGKVVDTPEVSRVFVGSFWDEPLHIDEMRKLFESEENDLYTTLAQLPRSAAVRKLNDLIKRARLAKVHAFLLDHLKKKMPSYMGKSKTQQKLLTDLRTVYGEVAKESGLPLGDFPEPNMMQDKLSTYDFNSFHKVDKKKMAALESMLTIDVPKLLLLVPEEAAATDVASCGVFANEDTPFSVMKTGGKTEATFGNNNFLIAPDVDKFRAEFATVGPTAAGLITGAQAKNKLVESKLPSNLLHRIWALADTDKDGHLDLYEYALAQTFVKMRLDGHELPATLPASMHPSANGWKCADVPLDSSASADPAI